MARISLVTLLVHDYDEAISFYVGKVGFRVLEDVAQPAGKRWIVVGPDDTVGVLLAQADTPEQRSSVGAQTGGRVGFFLTTDDFAGDHARMSEAGVRFLEQPRHEPYGTVAVFEDLYGTKWDLIQPA
ncbi:VOC family protein [Actinokineospora guangxiensis]|uniref:VOC family protein n=1 Tax=Actinokineospora guangxiensis TaxID=1490288 RepID=A0ABW0EPL1_9PSEU